MPEYVIYGEAWAQVALWQTEQKLSDSERLLSASYTALSDPNDPKDRVYQRACVSEARRAVQEALRKVREALDARVPTSEESTGE